MMAKTYKALHAVACKKQASKHTIDAVLEVLFILALHVLYWMETRL